MAPQRGCRNLGGVQRAGAGGAAAATASLSLRVGLPTPGAAAEVGQDLRKGGRGPETPEAARPVLFP